MLQTTDDRQADRWTGDSISLKINHLTALSIYQIFFGPSTIMIYNTTYFFQIWLL